MINKHICKTLMSFAEVLTQIWSLLKIVQNKCFLFFSYIILLHLILSYPLLWNESGMTLSYDNIQTGHQIIKLEPLRKHGTQQNCLYKIQRRGNSTLPVSALRWCLIIHVVYKLVLCSASSVSQSVLTIMKAPTSAFTFKTLLRHYAKWVQTPRSLNVKLGPRRKGHKGRAVWLAQCLRAARPL